MKILISESQYDMMVMELLNHPDKHDIDQRNLRMGLLESGIPVVIEYREAIKQKVGPIVVPKIIGKEQVKVVGTYIMTPEVTSEINNKLDDIYKYNFPPNKSYAILVHDFKLDSRDVVENKISYNVGPDDNSVKEEVLNAVKKKDLYNTRISFTQYEPSDKSDPRSPMSNRHRANYLIMIVDKNVAVTVFLTSKRQWEEKTFYRDEGWDVDEYIRYDQIGAHARLLPKYEKNLGNTTNEDSTLIEISKEVNESWIMEWINSSKK